MDGCFCCCLRCSSSSPVLSCGSINLTHSDVKQYALTHQCSVVQNLCLPSGLSNMQRLVYCLACMRSGQPLTASVRLPREDHCGNVDGCVWLTTPRGSIDSAFNMLPQVTVAHVVLSSLPRLHSFTEALDPCMHICQTS